MFLIVLYPLFVSGSGREVAGGRTMFLQQRADHLGWTLVSSRFLIQILAGSLRRVPSAAVLPDRSTMRVVEWPGTRSTRITSPP